MPVYPCVYREHVILKSTPFDIYRFIPVHTGNIFRKLQVYLIKTVYPCAYREHPVESNNISRGRGLSLCIQGTFNIKKFQAPWGRFIPVHTGNIPIITYCFIIKILTTKFLPIFLAIFYQN